MASGYRNWNVNDAISASDFNQYVAKQVVFRFATVALRNSGLTGITVDGMMAYCSDQDELYKRENGLWKGVVPRIKIKTATESVTSSTTLQNDDHLFLNCEASSRYRMDMAFVYDGAASAADIKFAIYGPAGVADDSAVGSGYYFKTNTSHVLQIGTYGFANGSDTADTLGANSWRIVVLEGVTFTTSGTAGNVGLQWAQNTSNGTATRVGTGSIIQMLKLA